MAREKCMRGHSSDPREIHARAQEWPERNAREGTVEARKNYTCQGAVAHEKCMRGHSSDPREVHAGAHQ